MAFSGNITFEAGDFQASSIDASTEKLNQAFEKATSTAPRWYQVGVAEYRQMVYEGKTQFPVPPLLPKAQEASVPSREPSRDIPIRVYVPDEGNPNRGIYLYFHGGGFIMGSHKEWVFLLLPFEDLIAQIARPAKMKC